MSYKRHTTLEQHLLESFEDGVFSLTPDWHYNYVNQSAAKMVGKTVDELIGKCLFDVFPDVRDTYFFKIYEEVMSSGIAQSFDMEYEPLKKWFKGNVYRSSVGITIIFTDDTDRKKLEQQLKEYIQTLEKSQELGKLGYWDYDVETKQIHWSSMTYRIYERCPDEGSPSFEELLAYCKESMREMLFEAINDAIQLGKSYSLNYEIISDGKRKHIHSIGYATYNTNGQVIKLHGIVQDVTEKEKLLREVRESDLRQQLAIDGADIGLMDLNLVTGENYINDKWWEMLGYSSGEISYSYDFFLSILHPSDHEKVKRSMNEIETGKHNSINMVVRLRHRNGEYKYILYRGKAIEFTESGKIQRLIGTNVDISKEHLYEEQLKLLNSRLSALANNLPGVIFMYYVDPDGSDGMPFVSEGASDIWGYSPAEIQQDLSLVWDQVHPDDLPLVQQAIQMSAQKMSHFDADWRLIKPGDQITWVRCIGTPFKGNNGRVFWNSIILNTTSAKQDELKLIKREAFFKGLADSAFDAIVSFDKKGKINYYNQVFKSWVGEIDQRISPEQYPKLAGILNEDLSGYLDLRNLVLLTENMKENDIVSVQFAIKNKAQTNTRYVEADGTILQSDKGERFGSIFTIRDITEKRNRIAALEKRNAMLQNIAWEQSHKVRAPLARVKGLVELLANGNTGDKSQKEMLELIEQSADELDVVIKDIVSKSSYVLDS